MITSNPLDGARVPGTVGYPLPGVTARLRGEDGQAIAEAGIGVLEIRSPGLFSGYRGNQEQTEKAFRDGWFITGDLATQATDGRITLVVRQSDLIISGGLNVYPKEVEAALDAQPAILESAVIGVPHPDFGEAVVAMVVLEEGCAFMGEDECIAALREGLAAFKLPKRVLVLPSLPRNTMGKVEKKRLRAAASALFTAP
jgi:malonyl-CoA/methylmalonyl-CoA synthetase